MSSAWANLTLQASWAWLGWCALAVVSWPTISPVPCRSDGAAARPAGAISRPARQPPVERKRELGHLAGRPSVAPPPCPPHYGSCHPCMWLHNEAGSRGGNSPRSHGRRRCRKQFCKGTRSAMDRFGAAAGDACCECHGRPASASAPELLGQGVPDRSRCHHRRGRSKQ